MQPEDIIQTKEWQQLTEGESQIVAPLAANEGEYGVLKKMLLVVQEEAMLVPKVSPQVQRYLQQELSSAKPAKRRLAPYVAAAAVLVLLVTGYFLSIPESSKPVADTPAEKRVENRMVDTADKSYPPLPPSAEESGVVAKRPIDNRPLPKTSTNDVSSDVQTPQVSTAVDDNIALLDLVTEVY